MMRISSPAFDHEGSIPVKYTCDGNGISPPLVFEDVPDGTKALVLFMEDPDVPTDIRENGLWIHWVVFNIPPDTCEITEGTEPNGMHGKGTSGSTTYYGPCPPDREHRYFFKLYALDSRLDVPEGASWEEVGQAMEGRIVSYTELMGKYNRV